MTDQKTPLDAAGAAANLAQSVSDAMPAIPEAAQDAVLNAQILGEDAAGTIADLRDRTVRGATRLRERAADAWACANRADARACARGLIEERPRAVASAALSTGASLAWYALPDLVRSRGLRAVLKTGLIGALLWSFAGAFEETEGFSQIEPIVDPEHPCSKADDTGFAPDDEAGASDGPDPLEGVTEADPKELAVLGAVVVGAVCSAVAVEKWIFRRGERRRAAGIPGAHLRQALPLALLTGVVEAVTLCVDDPRRLTSDRTGAGSCARGALPGDDPSGL
ncbi:hypothetical protein M3T53_09755 [Actinomyces sp. B33]|uniref:hypothetical protein n=1 Tax=Actinomyces sp. B33 TaxID=2942131 RepID=UPI0023427363|nr:hypothetical protein [Actinomyces sp. B33]MDC4233976.1 hypothetical protein [Actinomyces sp. B33]